MWINTMSHGYNPQASLHQGKCSDWKKRSDHLQTGCNVIANSNLPFILCMVSCHCSLCVRTRPKMERSILRCTTSNLCICIFVNGKTARPNVAVGDTTNRKISISIWGRRVCLKWCVCTHEIFAHAAWSRWSNSTFVRETKSRIKKIQNIYVRVHHAKSAWSHVPLLQNTVLPDRHWSIFCFETFNSRPMDANSGSNSFNMSTSSSIDFA